MVRFVVTVLALQAGMASAQDWKRLEPSRRAVIHVDLRYDGALAQLARDNPAHYRRVVEMVEPAPARVLPVEVGFSSMAFKTSYPPKQTRSFELDEVRYTVHVVRSDLTARSSRSSSAPANSRSPGRSAGCRRASMRATCFSPAG